MATALQPLTSLYLDHETKPLCVLQNCLLMATLLLSPTLKTSLRPNLFTSAFHNLLSNGLSTHPQPLKLSGEPTYKSPSQIT